MANAKPKFRAPPQIEKPQRLSIEEASRQWRARQAEIRRRDDERKAAADPRQLYRIIDVRPARMSAKDIISTVAAFHEVRSSDITGASRNKKIVQARFDAIRAVADAWPDLSLPAIGRIFGGRDHSTIHYSLEKTRKPGQGR